MTQLVEDYCHWCEGRVSRPTTDAPINPFMWIDEEDSAVCLFHPANFDARNMTATGETAFHQTIEDVHDIIIEDHYRKKERRAHKPLRAVQDNSVIVAKNARATSRAAAEKIEPNSGTIRYQIYKAIKDRNGLTDFELETLLQGKHQSVSASRRSLVVDGWVVDSGITRKNSQGNDCIVWVVNRVALTQGVLL